MNTICDYCLMDCTLGIDAKKVDDNIICRECYEEVEE